MKFCLIEVHGRTFQNCIHCRTGLLSKVVTNENLERVIELRLADLHVQVIRTRVDLGSTESSVSQPVGLNPDTKLSVVMTTEGVENLCLL
jgi:hypothetical protein